MIKPLLIGNITSVGIEPSTDGMRSRFNWFIMLLLVIIAIVIVGLILFIRKRKYKLIQNPFVMFLHPNC